MSKFNIGDRVIIVSHKPRYDIASVGSYGTVLNADDERSCCSINFEHAVYNGVDNTKIINVHFEIENEDLELYEPYNRYTKLRGLYERTEI